MMGLEGVWKDEARGVLVRLMDIKPVSGKDVIYGPLSGRVEMINGNWVGDTFEWMSTKTIKLTSVLPRRDLMIIVFSARRRKSCEGWYVHGITRGLVK